MVTLTGMGGVGKTRLALAAATAARHRFTHGVAYVELAPLRAADEVLLAIADAVDAPIAAGTDAVALRQHRGRGVGSVSHGPFDGRSRAVSPAVRRGSSRQAGSRRGSLLLNLTAEPEILICTMYIAGLVLAAGVMALVSAMAN